MDLNVRRGGQLPRYSLPPKHQFPALQRSACCCSIDMFAKSGWERLGLKRPNVGPRESLSPLSRFRLTDQTLTYKRGLAIQAEFPFVSVVSTASVTGKGRDELTTRWVNEF